MEKKWQNIKRELGTVEQVMTFNVGDILMSYGNWEAGLYIFFKATNYDVSEYSGKGKPYIKLNIKL